MIQPYDLAAVEITQKLYVVDQVGCKIYVYSTSSASLQEVYGSCGEGQGQFDGPRGIDTNLEGTFAYVLDRGNFRIVKLSLGTGAAVSSKVPGSEGAVAFIPKINYTDFKFPRIALPFSGTTAPDFSKMPNNEEMQTAITSDITYLSEIAISPTIIAMGIAVDSYGDVYITDAVNSQILKYTSDLQYVTTFGSRGLGDNEFLNPIGITFPDGLLNFYVIEEWGTGSGGQDYVVGTDIQNFNAWQNGNNMNMSFTLTAPAAYELKIKRSGTTIRSYAWTGYVPTGSYPLSWDGKNNSGAKQPRLTYTAEVHAVSQTVWADDGQPTAEVTKTTSGTGGYVVPVALNVTDCLERPSSAISSKTAISLVSSSVVAPFAQATIGSGNPSSYSTFKWKWWVIQGGTKTLIMDQTTYSSSSTLSGVSNYIDFSKSSFTLEVAAYRGAYLQDWWGKKSKLISIQNSCSGSCPYVATWSDSTWSIDNNILPQSEFQGNEGMDVEDHYLLQQAVEDSGGQYLLKIVEFENEHSYLDAFELITLDHVNGTSVAVTESGDVYFYREVNPISRVLLNGKNVTDILLSKDDRTLEGGPGDTLFIEFSNPDIKKITAEQKISIGAALIGFGSLVPGPKPRKDLAGSVLSPEFSSHQSGRSDILLRENPSWFTAMLTSNPNNALIEMSNDYSLDYIAKAVNDNSHHTITHLSLSEAIHSKLGDVTTLLVHNDSVYAELFPDEEIRISFIAPDLKNGFTRSFILKSNGKYEKITANQSPSLSKPGEVTKFIPEKYELFHNYPNPFNPVTQIDFALPEDSFTLLVIYDLRGREVIRLIDKDLNAGYHSVKWDANRFASGIYFYILQSGDFVQTKKMLLLK